MDNREFLFREVEILKQIPKDEVGDFIERNGGRLREVLTAHEEFTNREVMEALAKDYVSL